jgi:hypothetical protein
MGVAFSVIDERKSSALCTSVNPSYLSDNSTFSKIRNKPFSITDGHDTIKKE